MNTIIKCPACGRDLIKMVNLSALEPEKYYCPRCGGTWYEHDVARTIIGYQDIASTKGKVSIEFTEEELAYLQEALVESRVGWKEREGVPYSFEPEDWMQELLDKIEHARDMLDIKRMKKDGVK